MLLACGHEPKPQPPVSVGFMAQLHHCVAYIMANFFKKKKDTENLGEKVLCITLLWAVIIPWMLTDISHCGWVLHDMEWSKPHWTYITFSESNSFCCLWGNSDFLFLLNHKGASKKMPEMGFYFGKKYLFFQCPNSHITEIAGAVHPLLFKGWN